jgi:putative endonuclease
MLTWLTSTALRVEAIDPDPKFFNAMYYTYVIESGKDGWWYTGVTGDLKARLRSHLKGQVRSTHYRRPFRLVYYEACLSDADARRPERYLKGGRGKRYLKQRLASFFSDRG